MITTLAQAVPLTPEVIMPALTSGDWPLVIAAVLSQLPAVWRIVAVKPWAWVHTKLATVLMPIVVAALSAPVPLLTAHHSWQACVACGLLAGLAAILSMGNPTLVNLEQGGGSAKAPEPPMHVVVDPPAVPLAPVAPSVVVMVPQPVAVAPVPAPAPIAVTVTPAAEPEPAPADTAAPHVGPLLLTWWLSMGVFFGAALPACKASPEVVALTASIASVRGVDEGIAEYARQAPAIEHKIAADCIAQCKVIIVRVPFLACTNACMAPKRVPLDKARQAIAVYRAAVAVGSGLAGGNLGAAAAAVVGALADFGIHIGSAPVTDGGVR